MSIKIVAWRNWIGRDLPSPRCLIFQPRGPYAWVPLDAIMVFLIGFILGTISVLLLTPCLGETTAVILEAPMILAASWFVCGWCVDRLDRAASVFSATAKVRPTRRWSKRDPNSRSHMRRCAQIPRSGQGTELNRSGLKNQASPVNWDERFESRLLPRRVGRLVWDLVGLTETPIGSARLRRAGLR
jgi:hypothetical protein